MNDLTNTPILQLIDRLCDAVMSIRLASSATTHEAQMRLMKLAIDEKLAIQNEIVRRADPALYAKIFG